MNRTMDKVWQELFSPIEFRTGVTVMRFRQKGKKDTYIYVVSYNYLDKKWTVIARRWSIKPSVIKTNVSKSLEKRLIEKALKILEREWKI